MPRQNGLDAIGELYPGADVSAEAVELGRAMDRYKREHERPYPTWGEVLGVVRLLGYRKNSEIPFTNPDPAGK